MNHIEIRNTARTSNYVNLCWNIDGEPLYGYLNRWMSEYKNDKTVNMMRPFDDLCPAWTKELDWSGDVRFVWELIGREHAILPLLLCPDDLDFTCIVIVAEVEKTKDFVYWNKIGYVNHENESFEEEKRNGILNTDNYTDKDWERYGDNIAWTNVNSEEWCKWISENWAEELYRRRMNYTYPYYQTEGNINWLYEMNWCFDRPEYEKMVNLYWELETLWQLDTYKKKNKMSVSECADFISSLTRHGASLLQSHLDEYGEILLHIFAAEQICKPLIDIFMKKSENNHYTYIYCKAIEIMWKYGDDNVVNVVDVTILERLSDDAVIWKNFGTFISDEFRQYINNDVLKHNLMMCGVALSPHF